MPPDCTSRVKVCRLADPGGPDQQEDSEEESSEEEKDESEEPEEESSKEAEEKVAMKEKRVKAKVSRRSQMKTMASWRLWM